MIEFISQPWPWYVSGTVIASIMLILLYFGRSFGVSASLHAACAASGAGRWTDFFKFDWKKTQGWNFAFVLGAIAGGAVAANFLSPSQPIAISEGAAATLATWGISTPTSLEEGTGYLPEVFNRSEFIFSFWGMLFLITGGFLVGFGARYAGGCTSGHAISGISNLQWPSLLAVVGFFIGGLTMAYFIMPSLMPWILKQLAIA